MPASMSFQRMIRMLQRAGVGREPIETGWWRMQFNGLE
jgi:hypothetical protein